jgi:hypothetical protein
MEEIGKFYDHLVHFTAIWYILCLFDIISPVLVCCTKKNLATLHETIFLLPDARKEAEHNMYMYVMPPDQTILGSNPLG